MSSKVIFLLVTCVVGSMSQVLIQQANPTCTKNGEYCQNHWECCSQSCLSYSYKCVKSSQPQNVPSTISNGPANAAPPLGTITIDRNTLQNLIDSLFASTDRPANYNIPPSGVNLADRIGDEDTTTARVETPSPPAPCKVVGEKCYRNSECCTTRCHGFLHQCVT